MFKTPVAVGSIVLLMVGVHVGRHASAGPLPASSFCNQPLASAFPPRSATALSGTQLLKTLQGVGDDAREAAIRSELLAGNIPQFLRHLKPVTLDQGSGGGEPTRITVCVMPDYLALGSDDDFLLVPMRLGTALDVAYRH